MEITGIAIQVGEKLKHKPIIRVCNKLPMAILQQLSKKPDIAWIRSEKKKKRSGVLNIFGVTGHFGR